MFWGVNTVLGETTRNPTNTMVKPLDSNRAVAVVERCKSCLVSRSISNIRVVYALARRQKTRIAFKKARSGSFSIMYYVSFCIMTTPFWKSIHFLNK